MKKVIIVTEGYYGSVDQALYTQQAILWKDILSEKKIDVICVKDCETAMETAVKESVSAILFLSIAQLGNAKKVALQLPILKILVWTGTVNKLKKNDGIILAPKGGVGEIEATLKEIEGAG